MFRDANGNISSKRVIGAITYFIGLSMAIVTGLEFYNVSEGIIIGILSNGTLLLGIGTFERKQPGTS